MPHLSLTLTLSVDPLLEMREINAAERAVTERLSSIDATLGGGGGDAEGLVTWIIGVTTDLRPAAVISVLDDALLAETEPGGTLAGRTVTVEAVEARSAEATKRRLASLRLPDVVDTDTFRAILGTPGRPISRTRLYQLRDNPDFPRPISAGVWLRASAEHYAETRNRRAGRPAAPRRPGDRTYCAECLHDAATHGIDTDNSANGTPDDGAVCRAAVIENGTVLDHTCDCAGYRPSPAA